MKHVVTLRIEVTNLDHDDAAATADNLRGVIEEYGIDTTDGDTVETVQAEAVR